MIFGYANETENIIVIDISPYFSDIDNYDSNNNIITKLSEKLIIDNNIFGYIPANQIRLISIPNQIIFYNGNEIDPLSNGDILKFEHRINQNNNLIKNNDYYTFEFQFIIQEPDYETFYNYAHDLINDNPDINSENFEQKKFYGKTNIAKFKLCHEYCASCKTLGRSNDDQQCMSCLEEYQYDYFNEYPSNCVPFDYFNDKENKKLVKCNNTNSKFYINLENNKTICFKNTYKCPFEYPYLNISSNECKNYIPPTTIITTIPTTLITTIPTTLITTIPTTIITTIATTIITTILTTIITTIPTTIITTILTTIIKRNPTIIITSIPTLVNTRIPSTAINTIQNIISKTIPITFIEDICTYNKLVNNECLFENYNYTELYNKIKNEVIKSYPINGESVVINAEDN